MEPQAAPTLNPIHPPEIHPCGIIPISVCADSLMDMELDWFVHPSAPEFLICSRCYVDHIYNTLFQSSFRMVHLGAGQQRKCSFSTRRMKDNLWPEAVSSSSLSNAVEFMQKPQKIPHCTDSEIRPGASWYTSSSIPNATFCAACYEDMLMTSSFASNFTLSTGLEAFCDASTFYIRRIFDLYSPSNNWSAFCQQAQARIQIPKCEKGLPMPTSGYTWYETTRGPRGTVLCGACYSTMVNVWGGANWFIPKSSGFFKSDKRVRAFNVGHPRFSKNVNAFNECILRGTWKALGDLAAIFASVSPCLRSEPSGYGRQWWGWQNAQICEECYAAFAKGTPLEDRYTIRGARSSEGICDLYSPRMRNMYNDACQSGDLQSFLNHAAQRKQIFMQMNQTLDMLKSAYEQQNMKQKQMLMQKERMIYQDHTNRMTMLNQAHSDALIANNTKFMGDIHGCHGYAVGNSQMGWYKNETSFQGVVDLQKAEQLRQQALAPGLSPGWSSASDMLRTDPRTQMLQAEAERIEGLWMQVE